MYSLAPLSAFLKKKKHAGQMKSCVTHQSGKKFDAEEEMFLDLTLHFGMLFADEWVR